MKYDLKPDYNDQKSYVGKAYIEVEHDYIKLYSYHTLVGEIDRNENECKLFLDSTGKLYSPTTLKHIKEFLYQNGYAVGTLRQLISWYGV